MGFAPGSGQNRRIAVDGKHLDVGKASLDQNGKRTGAARQIENTLAV